MPSSPEEHRRVLARVRRIRGQIEALERALLNDTACAAVLQQIASVRGAVNGLMSHVIEDHVRHVMLTAVTDEERSEAVRDVTRTLNAYLK